MAAVVTHPLEVGRLRCHVIEVVPGVPGTSLALEKALADLDPGAVAADVDLLDVLAFRRAAGKRHAALPFAADQVRRALDRRDDDTEVQNPYQMAAEHAKREEVPFVPLLAEATRPGFFLRRRLARAYKTLTPPPRPDQEPPSPADLARAWRDVARSEPALKGLLQKEDDEAVRRFHELVVREQAVRVVAVVLPPRAEILQGRVEREALPRGLRDQPLVVEKAALEPEEIGKGLR